MKKEKGFTLIELLAVIIILAILMVIAVPKILNVIENSKKSAAESSIKLVKDAIKTQVTSGSIMDTNFTGDDDGCYTFNFDDQTSGNAKELQLKNKENITGSIKYCNGKFSNDTLVFNGVEIKEENKKVICKRAEKTTLHTDGTHTFGNKNVIERALTSGDAFDCDVNGDGEYNPDTERFYYVSDYYNTSTKEFEDDAAVLIYYNNISDGKPSKSATYAYDLSGENWHGPRTAIKQLPSTSKWKNVSLKNSVRAILNENGGNTTKGKLLPSDFSYDGKSARLLTAQELNKVCNITLEENMTNGELEKCEYLFENTYYSSGENRGYLIETPYSNSSDYSWVVHAYGSSHYVHASYVLYGGYYGVRPVIEVSKSNIEY